MNCVKRILIAVLIITLAIVSSGCKARDSQPEKKKGARDNVVIAENPKPPKDTALSKNESSSESEPEIDPEPEKKVRAMLAAAETGERAEIQNFIDYDTLMGIQSDQSSDEHFKQVLKNMKWQIVSVDVKEAAATVCAKISNIDMSVILPEYFNQATKLEYDNAFEEEPVSASALEAQYNKLFTNLIAQHQSGVIEKIVDIELKKSGGVWKISSTEDLSNAMLGGYISAKKRLGESAQVMAESPAISQEPLEQPKKSAKTQQAEEDDWYDEIDGDILG